MREKFLHLRWPKFLAEGKLRLQYTLFYMPSESGEWSYSVVRDLWNIWATEKTKSKTLTLTIKLPRYTHTSSQPTYGDTFLGVLVESGLAGTELICCSLSHRRFCGRLSHAETDALLEERSEDRGVCPYPISPWTFPMLVGLLQPPRLSPVKPNDPFLLLQYFPTLCDHGLLPLSQYIYSHRMKFVSWNTLLRSADPWSIKRPNYGRKEESA